MKIPLKYLKTANSDPQGFKLRYACIAEDTLTKFFIKETIPPCFSTDLHFIGEFTDSIKVTTTGMQYRYKMLDHWIENVADRDYVFAGDYSTVGDRTSLCIAHGEEVDQSTVDPAFRGFNIDVFIDLILIWQPDRKLNILVS